AVDAREQSLAQLLQLRQQRARGFLMSVESICAEPRPGGGFGWAEECTQTMVREFGASEGSRATSLTYRNRVLGRFGAGEPVGEAAPGAIGWFVAPGSGTADYAVRVTRGEAILTLLFDGMEVQRSFEGAAGLGPTGRIGFVHGDIAAVRPDCLVAP